MESKITLEAVNASILQVLPPGISVIKYPTVIVYLVNEQPTVNHNKCLPFWKMERILLLDNVGFL